MWMTKCYEPSLVFELEFGLQSAIWVFAVILRWDLQPLFKRIHPVDKHALKVFHGVLWWLKLC